MSLDFRKMAIRDNVCDSSCARGGIRRVWRLRDNSKKSLEPGCRSGSGTKEFRNIHVGDAEQAELLGRSLNECGSQVSDWRSAVMAEMVTESNSCGEATGAFSSPVLQVAPPPPARPTPPPGGPRQPEGEVSSAEEQDTEPEPKQRCRRVSFDEDEAVELDQEIEPDQDLMPDGSSSSSGSFGVGRRRAQSCVEPSSNLFGDLTFAAAGNPSEDLAACLEELGQAEQSFGPDDARVAKCLRRMALTLAYQGRSTQAVPLWIRVLEIERPLLGSDHPDVLKLEGLVRKELARPGIGVDAAAAYAAQLAGDEAAAGDAHAEQIKERSKLVSPAPAPSRNLAAAAASLGAASAAVVGGAVVSGALHFGLSAMSSTCSLLTSATGQIVSYASSHATAAVLGATSAPAPVISLAASAAGMAGSGVVGVARVTAGGAFGAVSQVGVAIASSATSSVISCASTQAWNLLYGSESEASGELKRPASSEVGAAST
ncbi:unnamed protein product [Polarella glacialis]|uniref:Uncharacterized protein n=1 Tax=Polarella glacialis TaxID=89957 RepID=A0A813FQX1_POLGL|nr:unnamed protein product [Polarella glacialis]